jgi:hypothetical protein
MNPAFSVALRTGVTKSRTRPEKFTKFYVGEPARMTHQRVGNLSESTPKMDGTPLLTREFVTVRSEVNYTQI